MKKLLHFSFFIFHFSFAYSQYMIYGTTFGGGAYYSSNNPNNYGTIFRYNPITNKQAIGFSFNDTNGEYLQGRLLYASDSMLYGMTQYGGTSSMGTLFSFNPKTNKETVLINFDGVNGAGGPGGSELIQGKDGFLYGTTWIGGGTNNGVLFSYDIQTYKDSIRCNFNDSTSVGSRQAGAYMELWQDTTTGMLFGGTEGGGFPGQGGVVYGFNPKNNLLKRYFIGPLNGNGHDPEGFTGGLTKANNGLLYGMSIGGGNHDSGTIYSFNTNSGTVQTVYSFGGAHGAYPNGNELLKGANGLLYGCARQGGDLIGNGDGVLFSFNTTTNTEKVLKTFHDTDGSQPWGRLIEDPDNGLLYGVTVYGGVGNLPGYGVLFCYNITTDVYTKLLNFTGPNGAFPNGLTLVKDTSVHVIHTAVSEVKNESGEVKAYPNPSDGIFQLEITNYKLESNNVVEVYNLLGEKVYSHHQITNASNCQIDLSTQPNGIYFYRITTQSGELIGEGKMIIQR